MSIGRTITDRQREDGHNRLYNDYFSENPIYPDSYFRRRFRMQKGLFLCIVDALSQYNPYFQLRCDATGRCGLSPLQKCTAAIRMLVYGSFANLVDDYVRIGESTTIDTLKLFVDGIIKVFGHEYLCKPNEKDVQRLLRLGERRGFLGMLGSIDCMHWEWKNCPTAWNGQHVSGHKRKATLILEAVASEDTWIWHAFFGTPGTCNDINVLERSPILDDILEGRSPPINFTINGNQYHMRYYLTNGIYPEYATFVKSISGAHGDKEELFCMKQESARKDVEQAFGVLQLWFAIVRGPRRAWNKEDLGLIMRACIILHNMIVEDERDTYGRCLDFEYDAIELAIPIPQI